MGRAQTYRHIGLAAVIMFVAASTTVLAQKPAPTDTSAKPAATSINLFELHKKDYSATREPAIIDLAPAKYLTLAGKGAPGGKAFGTSVGAIYGVGIALKLRAKAAGRDFEIGLLEALWWGTADKHNFVDEPRETWNWKILIRVPDFVSEPMLVKAAADAAKRNAGATPPDVKLEAIKEGKCIQVLHVGPYSTEAETIGRMRKFAKEKGLTYTAEHHEIYFGVPGTVAPEKMETVLRQPVK